MTRTSKILCVLCLVWGMCILANSLLPGGASTQMSDTVVNRLPGGVLGLDLHALTILVRKSAHFLEYAVLGGLAAAAFWRSGQLRLPQAGNLLGPCLFWAVADEFLQTFVEGRTGLVRDVVLDFAGVLAGVLVICLLKLLRRADRGNKNGKEM